MFREVKSVEIYEHGCSGSETVDRGHTLLTRHSGNSWARVATAILPGSNCSGKSKTSRHEHRCSVSDWGDWGPALLAATQCGLMGARCYSNFTWQQCSGKSMASRHEHGCSGSQHSPRWQHAANCGLLGMYSMAPPSPTAHDRGRDHSLCVLAIPAREGF